MAARTLLDIYRQPADCACLSYLDGKAITRQQIEDAALLLSNLSPELRVAVLSQACRIAGRALAGTCRSAVYP